MARWFAWVKFNYDVEELLPLRESGKFILYLWEVRVLEGRRHAFYVFHPLTPSAFGEEPVVVTPKGMPARLVRHALLTAVRTWLRDTLEIHPGEPLYLGLLSEVEGEISSLRVRAVARPHPEVYGFELIYL